MKFSYNWLQSFFGKKLLEPAKLAEVLSNHFAEVEEIKKKEADFILNIDIRPNRASDCFSYQGIAREISAISGIKLLKEPTFFKEEKNQRAKDFILTEIKDRSFCPRYTLKVIKGIKVTASPTWLQKRLTASGLRPINNVVDLANYVMLEIGQPLHAFDLEKITGKKIIIRKAKKDEKIKTLDQEEYLLDEENLVIADQKEALAIAGIKGGKKAEIDLKTKIIVLEAANFNFQQIRESSKKINLKTDASLRFEHGIDINLTEKAINRFCYLIEKIGRAQVISGLVDFYPKKLPLKKIRLDCDYVSKLLGLSISKKKIIKILESLDFKILKNKNQILIVEVPAQRLDVLIREDLVEEIGRIYGYYNIPVVSSLSNLIPARKNQNIFWQNKLKNILKEIGFSEVYNYSFFGVKDLEIFFLESQALVGLKNPLSREYLFLRNSLIPGLLKNIKDNLKNFKDIKVFEIAKIYNKDKEELMITGAIFNGDFFEAKGVVETFLNKIAISRISYLEPKKTKSKDSFFHLKNQAIIRVNNKEVGFLGEASLKMLNNLEIDKKIALFNINFEDLTKEASAEYQYQPISKFPSAIRDIAVLVPREVSVDRVLSKIYSLERELIKKIDLFDIYQGDNIFDNKKSLAFHIIFQAEDRTLSAEEIDVLQNRIINTLDREPEWQVRK